MKCVNKDQKETWFQNLSVALEQYKMSNSRTVPIGVPKSIGPQTSFSGSIDEVEESEDESESEDEEPSEDDDDEEDGETEDSTTVNHDEVAPAEEDSELSSQELVMRAMNENRHIHKLSIQSDSPSEEVLGQIQRASFGLSKTLKQLMTSLRDSEK
eukprot:sb/3473187/